MEIKLGFVGFGNMAQAIAKGLIGAGVLPGSQMYACAAHFDKLQRTAGELGVHPMATAQEVVEHSDWVILAVKPGGGAGGAAAGRQGGRLGGGGLDAGTLPADFAAGYPLHLHRPQHPGRGGRRHLCLRAEPLAERAGICAV